MLSPVIDGLLNDSCWRADPTAVDFLMLEPNSGSPASQPTFVYCCFDDRNLYIAARLLEDRIDQLQTTCNTRDGDVIKDDCFVVMLDTYHDRSNAYYFAANSQGVQNDGRIIDDGRTIDENWDGRWISKAVRDSIGWSIEIAIPFSELRHAAADSIIWGVNFYRIERPHGEVSSWSPVSAWCRVSQYGSLSGLTVKSRLQRFELLPYGMMQYFNRADSLQGKTGIDIRWSITPNLNANATILPDYAQVEADPYQFNLSYQQGQELYLPEKRPFFMEGSSILYTPLQLFYTRRVSDIQAGGKVYGTIGSTELLVVDAQTKDPERNYSLLRIKQGMGHGITGGLLATNLQRSDSFSRALGADLCMPVYGPLLLTLQGAGSENIGMHGDKWAGTGRLNVNTPTSSLNFYATRIGNDFSVAQGFISPYNVGSFYTYSYASRRFPLTMLPGFQYIKPNVDWSWKRELGGRPSSNTVSTWTDVVTVSKWRFEVFGGHSFERYGDDEYINRNIDAQVESNYGGMGGIFFSYSIGELYDLSFRKFMGSVAFQALSRITVVPVINAIEFERNKWRWITNTTISWRVSEKLSVRMFVQTGSTSGTPANDIFSRERLETINSNLLISYEVLPGSMLYLVYNQPRNFITKDFDNIFMAKFSYSLSV